MGQTIVFDNLGAGFDIRVGVRGLGAHRCESIKSYSTAQLQDLFPDSTMTVLSRSGTDSVVFEMKCRTANVALSVSGLPPGHTAVITVVSPDSGDSVLARVPNGTTSIVPIGANQAVRVTPQLVSAADGLVDDALAMNVTVAQRDTALVRVQYQLHPENQGSLNFSVIGIPNDSLIRFEAFVRTTAAPLARDSAIVRLGGFHQFVGIGPAWASRSSCAASANIPARSETRARHSPSRGARLPALSLRPLVA
jgi:hypothetical protein